MTWTEILCLVSLVVNGALIYMLVEARFAARIATQALAIANSTLEAYTRLDQHETL